MYIQPLSQIILSFDMLYHKYSDDTQLHQSAFPDQFPCLLETLQSTVHHVKEWMTSNKLKMNAEKTELIPHGTESKLKAISHISSLSLADSQIQFSASVRDLGVHLDQSLSMEKHVNAVCKAVFLEIRRISHIRPFLSVATTQKLVSAFVLSRLDYCNSLLSNLPNILLDRLQRAQNHAARLVLRKRKFDHANPLLIQLHWLPVRARIHYKIATLCFRSLHGLAPSYLSDLLQPYRPSRLLRSSDAGHLVVPRIHLNKYGKRTFSFNGPSVWNGLPPSLRNIQSFPAFKANLKTHLFRRYLLDD